MDAALTRLYAIVPLADYPRHALDVARELIGCIHCSYNEIDVVGGRHRIAVDVPEILAHEAAPRFHDYVHQHPVISHHAATGDERSHLISDFLTRREFQRLDLYGEFFRPLDTETQLSTTLRAGRGRHVIGIALNRGGGGFDERDRSLLDLLRPHLLVSHHNAARLTAAIRGDAASRTAERTGGALSHLTERQLEILGLVAEGQTNAQIAFRLGVRVATVKKHMEHILERLEVPTRTAAAAEYLTSTDASEIADEE